MSANTHEILDFLIAGKLQRDTVIPLKGSPLLDVLGGGLAYAAAGLCSCGDVAGLIAKASSDYPMEWLERLERADFDLQGIKLSRHLLDERWFVAYSDPQTAAYKSPINEFTQRGLPFPKHLLSYAPDVQKQQRGGQFEQETIRISDIPQHYLDARSAHICPMDAITQQMLPNALRRGNVQTVTMSAFSGYMDPIYWELIPGIVSDLTAFFTLEEDMRRLFQGRTTDLWEMAEGITALGPEFVLIRLKDGAHYLFDAVNKKRWAVPIYPVLVVDPTGVEDAFAAAWLSAYRKSFNPVKAAVSATITQSFVMEGTGAYYVLDAMPALREARLAAYENKALLM